MTIYTSFSGVGGGGGLGKDLLWGDNINLFHGGGGGGDACFLFIGKDLWGNNISLFSVGFFIFLF